MDGVQYSDISDVIAIEDTYDWLFQEDGDDYDMEISIAPDYSTLDSRLRSQGFEGEHQDESSQCSQPSTSLQPSELPATTETLLQNQKWHSLVMANYEAAFEASYEAAFMLPEGVPSPEADAHTAVTSPVPQQDTQHQSRNEQLCSELSVLPFSLPLPHKPMVLQNPHPLTTPEERKQSSRERLLESQSTEPNPWDIINLEEMNLAVASTAAQQDTLHQSHHQQPRSELTIPPFSLPVLHTSIPMQNPEPLPIPEERNSSSREGLVESQSTEPNPQQMSRLEKMQKLTETFSRMRSILGFSRENMRLVLMNLSRKYIISDLIYLFDGFNILFPNMCQFKSLLERLQKDLQTSRTTSYSLRNKSKSVDCGMQEDETIATTEQQEIENVFLQKPKPDTRTNGAVCNDRSDSTTGENMGDWMSNERSHGSDDVMIGRLHNENLIGEDDVNQDDPMESVNSTASGNCESVTNEQAVPRRFTGNNHSRYTVPRFNDMTWIPSLLFPDMVRACRFLQSQPKQMISLEEMQEFIKKFKKWRKDLLRFTRGQVVSELKKMYRIQMSKRCILQLETFNESFERMYEMKPAAEEWLKDIHISETQDPIFGTQLQTLQDTFQQNPDPNGQEITSLAKSVNLDNAFVTIWFQKRRQIQDCINRPIPTSTHKDKENILQDHLQRALMYNMQQNNQFRTYHGVFTLPERVPSSEADAHTDVASRVAQQDMKHQSRNQRLRSELTNPPFSLPLPHTSMSMRNPEPLTIPEEPQTGLREGLVESQSNEPNPWKMSKLEKMQELAKTFRKMRNILGFSKEHIRLVLMKLSRKYIMRESMNLFEGFNVFFPNMCLFKSLLELLQKDVKDSWTTSNSLRNKSKSVDCGMQGDETVATTEQKEMENIVLQYPKPDTRTNGAVSNDRPESTTGENIGDEMSKERSDGSDDVISGPLHNENLIGDGDGNQEDLEESVNSTVSGNCELVTNKQAVRSRFTINNSHSRHIAPRFSDMTERIPSLLFPDMVRACQFLQSQQRQMISLEEMKEFVKKFKKWRKDLLRISQDKVISALKERYGIQVSKYCILQFEGFNESFERMCEMEPALEEWLKDIHISKSQVSIFGTQLQTLQDTFQQNPDPNAEEISNLAKSVNLDNAFVTIWFQKRREIQDCINSPNPTSANKDKENISQVS